MERWINYLALFFSGQSLTIFDLMAHLTTQGAGSGFVGFKLSLIMVKLGSCVAKPNMIKSAEKNKDRIKPVIIVHWTELLF